MENHRAHTASAPEIAPTNPPTNPPVLPVAAIGDAALLGGLDEPAAAPTPENLSAFIRGVKAGQFDHFISET